MIYHKTKTPDYTTSIRFKWLVGTSGNNKKGREKRQNETALGRGVLFPLQDHLVIVAITEQLVCQTLQKQYTVVKGKAVPLHVMKALGGRGGIAPTHSRPRH
jgi:hypothetical protein